MAKKSKVKEAEATENEEPTADDAGEQAELENEAPGEGGDDEARGEGVGEENMELPDEGERDTGMAPAPKGYKASDSDEPASPSADEPEAQSSDPTVQTPDFTNEEERKAVIEQQRHGTKEGRTLEEDQANPAYRDA